MNHSFTSLTSIISLLLCTITISAADLTGKRIYVDPGHGGWTNDDRPMATIPYPKLPETNRPDTLGFYESNTNLWKCLYLGEKLEKAGATVFYSRTKNGPNKTLSTRAEEVEANNIDYFISVHSNAHTEGNIDNYPLYLFRGPTKYNTANTTDSYQYVPGSYEKAYASWDYCNEIMLSGINPSTSYKTSKYIAGDQNFYQEPYDSKNSHSGKTYYGYLGVLKHGASGFLVEGYFHTYQPARHRALNPDYCAIEGLAYYRGIIDYYNADKETKGYILGAVRSKTETFSHTYYKANQSSNDKYKPINGAKVVLRNDNGSLVYCNCYPYVARMLKDQPYYTTDNNYNGIFMFDNLDPGSYTIAVHATGYQDYYGTIEVNADKTTYSHILLTPGTGSEPNIADLVPNQPSYIELPDLFDMQQSYVNQPIDNVLADKTIRRAIYGNGMMYVLAVDKNKEPILLEVNPATHLVTATLPTNHCSVVSSNGYKLSDITFTHDGVLIGCNMEAVTFTPSNQWKLYKWHKNNIGIWTGTIWLSHANNETAGNFNNAMVGATLAHSGISHNGTIVTTASSTSSPNKTRFVIYRIENNEITTVIRNQLDSISLGTYGNQIQMNKSPLGDDRFIFTSATNNGLEWKIVNTTKSEPTIITENIINTYGANYFKYAGHTLIATPSLTNGQCAGVSVYDITNGFATPKTIRTSNTTLDTTSTTYAMAAAQVDSLDLTLYLLQDNSLSKFTTIGIEQPIIPHINAYNLRAKQDKQTFTFTFTSNSNAESAALVFYDKSSSTELGRRNISVSKGQNKVTVQIHDLPGTIGQELTWAIDLNGLVISNWGKINVPNNNFTRPFVTINNNPQSEYFQYLYISERAGSAVNGNGLYVFTPDYTRVNDAPYKGGRSVIGSPYSCNVDDQGYIWLSDGSDSYSGIFIVDQNDPTATHQTFFQGTRSSSGLITNNSQGVGSSITGLSFYGTGESTKLLTINEDAGSGLADNSLSIYNIGTTAGSYIHTWSTSPNKNIDLPDVGTYYAYPLGCSHGVWIALYHSSKKNISGNASLQFYDWEGNRKMCSLDAPYSSFIDGSDYAACVMNKDESILYFVDGSGNIMVWDIEWTPDHTPNMTLRYSYTTGLTGIREMQLDYAGNLICSSDDEDITVFTTPTTNNHTLVPASDSQSICKNYIAPQSITLSHSSIELLVGNTSTLTATLLPTDASNSNILWSSADSTIATVSKNGTVTALKKGTTTIYAIAEEDNEIMALCIVHVFGFMSEEDACRIWAYDLTLTSSDNKYTFAFKSTTYATKAYLLFMDEGNEEIGRYALDLVKQGENSFTLEKYDIKVDQDTLYWAIELHSDRIANITEITKDEDKYYFYLPQGIAINNNPYSKHFGKIYVAEPYAGASDGASKHSKTQTIGIYAYDVELNLANYAQGYVPSNVTVNPADKHNTLHRLAINPLTSEVVFTQSVGAYVWAANPADLNAEAVNLVDGLGIAVTNSVCFDENGVMYVFDAATEGGGTLYKVVDGDVAAVVSIPTIVNDRNSLATDGHGGVWIGQYRGQLDTYNYLTHVNAAGQVDYEVNANAADDIKAMFPANMNRGHIAYDVQRDVLALGGGGKVNLYNAVYDEDGTPTLTKWTETPMFNSEKPAWNVDGIAFDYAGDLYVACASNERFYKYALPTDNNMSITPAVPTYIQSNSTTTATDNVHIAITAEKVFHNGQIFIIRNGKVYTIQGTIVKD